MGYENVKFEKSTTPVELLIRRPTLAHELLIRRPNTYIGLARISKPNENGNLSI